MKPILTCTTFDPFNFAICISSWRRLISTPFTEPQGRLRAFPLHRFMVYKVQSKREFNFWLAQLAQYAPHLLRRKANHSSASWRLFLAACSVNFIQIDYLAGTVLDRLLGDRANNLFGQDGAFTLQITDVDPYYEAPPKPSDAGQSQQPQKLRKKAIPPGLTNHEEAILKKVPQ